MLFYIMAAYYEYIIKNTL